MALVYSCCFWFSLRLGGIIIAAFSAIQMLLVLVATCIALNNVDAVKDFTSNLIENMKLGYVEDFLENVESNTESYLTVTIVFSCVYLLLCVFFIYAAFVKTVTLMLGYILIEFFRLLLISAVVIIWLLIIKENSMNIGHLIGASVASGSILLGMFYLWICAANLPVLINEAEKDEQAAIIANLKQMVEHKSTIYDDDEVYDIRSFNNAFKYSYIR